MQWGRWLARLGRTRPPQRLRLRESLSLGERRFVAVVEFERQQFLIAGTSNSVSLLAQLPARESRNQDGTEGAET